MKGVLIFASILLVTMGHLPALPTAGWLSCSCTFARTINQACDSMYDVLKGELQKFHDGGPNGTYDITALGQDHEAPYDYYIKGARNDGSEDQQFMYIMSDVADENQMCRVEAISVGNNWCLYDFGSNYCGVDAPLSFWTFEAQEVMGCTRQPSSC